jgi:hypothetical protein
LRLPNSEHLSRHWRIEEIAPEFRLEDVWALPATGGAGDFARLLELMGSLDPANGGSLATRVLFSIRFRLGGWLGWDDRGAQLPIPGDGETTLRARLPEDLRGTADPGRGPSRFTPLYRTDEEWAAEISNRTVHAIMHLVWIDRGGGRYQGQMGVYVKPRGGRGSAYMAAIAPFRHHIVYPALMRQIERAWKEQVARA